MRQFRQTIWLYVLRTLVVIKQIFFHVSYFLRTRFQPISLFFRNTIGLFFYKWWFRWTRGVLGDAFSFGTRISALIGTRFSLQIIVFMMAFVVLLPHTKFVIPDTLVSGRNSVLYALVGSGDEFLGIEEVVADVTANHVYDNTQNWRLGAVTAESSGSASAVNTVEDLVAISAGGTAITKPTILSSDAIASVSQPVSGASSGGRTSIEYYEVQPGDVIGSIAEQYGIHVETILWANNLTARSYIRPGDRLRILPVDGIIHKVERGDTVAKIARLYDAEQTRVIDFNKLQNDGSDIVIGEELIIPGGSRQQTVSTPAQNIAPSTFRRVTAPPPSVETPAGTGYVWPTAVRRITQYFGLRHTGVDIAGPIGTPLYAARAGTVIKSQCGWNGGYGCYVILDHGGGINTLYAHASQLLVAAGETVTQGQTLALMGSTGNSTGPHIHFEVRVNGVRTNPLSYVR